mgnify:CR=1 FL=1
MGGPEKVHSYIAQTTYTALCCCGVLLLKQNKANRVPTQTRYQKNGRALIEMQIFLRARTHFRKVGYSGIETSPSPPASRSYGTAGSDRAAEGRVGHAKWASRPTRGNP